LKIQVAGDNSATDSATESDSNPDIPAPEHQIVPLAPAEDDSATESDSDPDIPVPVDDDSATESDSDLDATESGLEIGRSPMVRCLVIRFISFHLTTQVNPSKSCS